MKNAAMKCVVSIVDRGRGKDLIRLYTGQDVFLHCQCAGRGTATSEIMDILGLDSSEKDVVLSYTTGAAADSLLEALDTDLRGSAGASGIVFDLSLTGLNNLVASAIQYKTEHKKGNGGDQMEQGGGSSLILITCRRGCADAVMDTAKGAGARGGTVIKARWAGLEGLEESYGLEFQAEREIVAIVVPTEKRNGLMDAVNAAHGLKSEAQAMLCSLPIDRIVRLG